MVCTGREGHVVYVQVKRVRSCTGQEGHVMCSSASEGSCYICTGKEGHVLHTQ